MRFISFFKLHVNTSGATLDSTPVTDIDDAMCVYLEHLWNEGGPKLWALSVAGAVDRVPEVDVLESFGLEESRTLLDLLACFL